MALYAEITSIEVPSSASAGSRVDVRVTIKNKASYPVDIMIGGVLEYGVSPWPTISFPVYKAGFPGGQSYYFDGYFTMPSLPSGAVVTIHIYSYFYYFFTGYGSWVPDDEKTKVVTAIAPLSGTINKKELKYDSVQTAIPVSSISQGKSAQVHVWGRNDTTSSQSVGMSWVVVDPDYQVVEAHQDDWAFGPVGAGQDREFIGDRFNLSKAGTYRISIYMYMDSGNPQVVDEYIDKILCTIAVTEPSITQFKIADYAKV